MRQNSILPQQPLSLRSKGILLAIFSCCFLYTVISSFSSGLTDELYPPEGSPRVLQTDVIFDKPQTLENKMQLNMVKAGNNDEIHDPNAPKRAIALISFGEMAAEGTLLERCILSIRRRGEFDGKVVVITDAPKERYDGQFDENVFVLRAKEEDILYNYFDSPRMKYKRFKTLLIDYISDVPGLDDIEFIYYMDIDSMFGSSFAELARDLDEKYGTESGTQPLPTIYMFRGTQTSKFPLNSGFIVMNRFSSKPCLDKWREEMDQHPDAYFDQSILNKVLNIKYDDRACYMFPMNHAKYVTYPESDRKLRAYLNLGKFSPMIHIFNSCYASQISEEITEEFVANVLQLTEEEKAQHKYGKEIIRPKAERRGH